MEALIEKTKTTYSIHNKHKEPLKLIPYIGCKAGFKHVFDELIDEKVEKIEIYDVFGGGGAFSFYMCDRFGSEKVNYNDNNKTVVNLISHLQKNPMELFDGYQNHYHNSIDNDDYFYLIREKNIEKEIEGAVNFLFLCKNAFSGKIRFNKKGRFNTPKRKGSRCPKIEWNHLKSLSQTIKYMTITNEDYQYFNRVKNSFIYLDPPYFNNTNGHYNGVLSLQEFNSFMRKIENDNYVMLSEQNNPEIFNLSSKYKVFDILLKRSLQYATKRSSCEIIACNY